MAGQMLCLPWNAPPVSCGSLHQMFFYGEELGLEAYVFPERVSCTLHGNMHLLHRLHQPLMPTVVTGLDIPVKDLEGLLETLREGWCWVALWDKNFSLSIKLLKTLSFPFTYKCSPSFTSTYMSQIIDDFPKCKATFTFMFFTSCKKKRVYFNAAFDILLALFVLF